MLVRVTSVWLQILSVGAKCTAAPALTVEPERLDELAQPPAARARRSAPRARRDPGSRVTRSASGSISKNRTRSGRDELSQHVLEPLARIPGPRRDAESRMRQTTPSGSFQVRKSQNSSAPMQEERVAPRARRAACRPSARAESSSTSCVGERRPREPEPCIGIELHLLVPGPLADEHDELREPEAAARRHAPARRDRCAVD